jgi:hypothetical protein
MAIRLNNLTHRQELFSLRNDKTIDNPLAKGSNRNIKKLYGAAELSGHLQIETWQ